MSLPPKLARFIGSGMTSQRARDRLMTHLQALGIQSDVVLDTLRFTPRHVFIDEALATHAYDNNALPIGFGQTISQPYIVALMTETLLARGVTDTVLEIGTGCGYQTAILAQLVGQVYTVERIAGLSQNAQRTLSELGLKNIAFHLSDGHWGWAEHAPYQGIIVTAAPCEVPPELLQQLRIGGHMLIPVGQQHSTQQLRCITRHSHTDYHSECIEHVSFVPLREGLA